MFLSPVLPPCKDISREPEPLLIVDVSGFAFKQNNIEVYLWGMWVFFWGGGVLAQ